MEIAHIVAKRSTCPRASVGTVIVTNKMMVSSGYNGAPRGLPHCEDVGCKGQRFINEKGEEDISCLRVVHSEVNAIAQAARHGIAIDGADLYCTHSPCKVCLPIILNAGIRRIFYAKPYRLETIEEVLQQSGVEFIQVGKSQ